jgi:hypothetical protein
MSLLNPLNLGLPLGLGVITIHCGVAQSAIAVLAGWVLMICHTFCGIATTLIKNIDVAKADAGMIKRRKK